MQFSARVPVVRHLERAPALPACPLFSVRIADVRHLSGATFFLALAPRGRDAESIGE